MGFGFALMQFGLLVFQRLGLAIQLLFPLNVAALHAVELAPLFLDFLVSGLTNLESLFLGLEQDVALFFLGLVDGGCSLLSTALEFVSVFLGR